jgi:iron complex outermembrane recepter protein
MASEAYGWKLNKDNTLLNENRENRSHLIILGMAHYRPTNQWNLSIAGAFNHIRYKLTDLFPANGDQSGIRNFPLLFSPRVGINYLANENITFFASVGHGFSLPSPEETLLPAGDVNPDILPEKGIQLEAGSRITLLNKRMYMDASLYQIELNNLLVTKRLTEDIFTGINAGKSRHQGFELQVTGNLLERNTFPGTLQSTLSYTWNNHRFIDFTDNEERFDGNQLPGIPNQVLYLQANWKPFSQWSIEANTMYHGEQFLNDANSLKSQSYFLANIKSAFIFKMLRGSFHIYTGMNNFLDTRHASMVVVNAIAIGTNEPRYYYPGMPRHGYIGIKYAF